MVTPSIASIVAWAIVAPVLLMFAVFVVEVLAGLLPSQRRVPPASRLSTVVVVPAHNEAASIAATLAGLAGDLPEQTGIMVVADNCTDDTAALAAAGGARVLERRDAVRRGKGFALAFAREALAADPPGCIVVMDADCTPHPGTIAALRDAVAAWDVPVQSTNLLRADRHAPPLVQISNFAFLMKNLVRQRGVARIGGATVLGGTGMALPWAVFAEAPLASDDLVEDLSLGIFAARRDRAPRFLETARVTSDAAAQGSTLVQRTRWEHGFLDTARRHALPLLAEGAWRRRWPQFWLGLHLCVPPLALLVTTGGAALALAGAIGALFGPWAPAIAMAAALVLAGLAVLLGWALHGRGTLGGGALLRLPLYVLWKLPVYLKFGRRRQTAWVRTRRQGE